MAEGNDRACEGCGEMFPVQTGRGRPRRFCQVCRTNSHVPAGNSLEGTGLVVTGGIKTCGVCGHWFLAVHRAQSTCGHECHKRLQQEHAKRTWLKRRGPKQESVTCANPKCRVQFHSGYGDFRSKYCSQTCSNRHRGQSRPGSNDRRRAKKYGAPYEFVNPIKVLDRDGWKCHLCGKQLRKEDRGTHKPVAPEIDHVIPLAAGGSHSYSNVACACRSCNAAKGARVEGRLAA